jgi:hypothetical protein
MEKYNILEERLKSSKCCGGEDPNCKCVTKKKGKESMMSFFQSMNKNFIEKDGKDNQ